MSSTIDERIVEMQFNNKRFEQNVSTSISTLDRLKAALNFDTASKNIESIERGFEKLNFSGVSSAVDAISDRFTVLGIIGKSILEDIGHWAFNAGQRVLGMFQLKNMTFTPFTTGWDKYAEKTTAVQTIMSATSNSWQQDADRLEQINALVEQGFDVTSANAYLTTWQNVNKGMISTWRAAKDLGITVAEFTEKTKDFGSITGIKYVGSQMDYVNSQMEKLNWFTDETSYNFTDMVSNIGKFTANNIPLSEATTAMQGIATWAAKSGQNATTASRVMYNMAQAIGVGAVKMQDWRSVETANMATAEFKQQVIEAAVANGKLKKTVDRTGKAVYRTMSGMEVSVENFANTLATGWFDKSVLMSTLNEYGAFTDKLHEFSELTGMTATETLQLIDAQKKGTVSQAEYAALAKDAGISVEELKDHLTVLGSDEMEFGRKAFQAAQEAKTFQEAIDATAEAAATKWSKIFENIFGDYEKAKELWTGFSEFLYTVFVEPLEKLEEVSEILGQLNAVNRIARGFGYIFSFFKGDGVNTFGVFDSIAKGIRQIFPPVSNLKLAISKVLTAFTRWGKSIQLTEKQAIALRSAARGLARIFKLGVLDSVINLWNATEPLRTALSNLVSAVVNLFIKFGQAGNGMKVTALSGEILKEICEKLATVIDKVSEAFDNLSIDTIREKFNKVKEVIDTIKQSFINFWNATEPLRLSLEGLLAAITGLIGKILEVAGETEFSELKFEGLQHVCEQLASKIQPLTDAINGITTDDIREAFQKLKNIIDEVKKAFSGLQEKLDGFSFSGIVTGIKNGFLSALTHVKNFVTGGGLLTFIKWVGGIILAACALWQGYIVYWLVQPIKRLSESIGEIADLIWSSNLKNLSATIRNIAIAIGILAVALLVLSFVDYDKAIFGLFSIAAIMAAIYLALMSMKNVPWQSVAKLGGLAASLLVVAAAFLIFSISLIAISAAIWIMTKVAKDIGSAVVGILILIAVVGILIAAMDSLSKIAPQVFIGAGALLVISAALIVLAIALGIFSLIAKDFLSAIGGVVLIGIILYILVKAIEDLAKSTGKVLIGATSLIIIGAALIVLAIALGIFSLIAKDFLSAIGGVVLIGLVLYILVAAIEQLGKITGKLFKGVAALLLLSVALIVLGAALNKFTKIAKNGMDSIYGLGLMLGVLAISVMAMDALAEMGPKIFSGVAALLILSVALIALSFALGSFTKIASQDSSGFGFLLLAFSLGVLVAALYLLAPVAGAVIPVAGALLIVALACVVLAGAIFVVSLALPSLGVGIQVLAEGIGAGLIALSEGILGFGANMAIMIYQIAVYLAMGIEALLTGFGKGIGTAVAAIGEGIGTGFSAAGQGIATAIAAIATGLFLGLSLLATGIIAVAQGIGAAIAILTESIASGITALGNGIGLAIVGIALGISLGLTLISAGIQAFGEGIGAAASGIGSGIGEGFSSIGEGVGSAIESIAGGISEGLTSISEGIVSLGEGIAGSITAISESVSGSLSLLGEGVSGFGDGVGALIESVLGSVASGVEELIASVGKGIADGISAIGNSISDVGTGLGDISLGITSFGDALRSLEGIKWIELGLGITEIATSLNKLKIKNLDTTVTDATTGITEACTNMSSAIQSALEDTYKLIDSGGETIVTNAATGIKSKLSDVQSAGVSIGTQALSGMRSSSSGAYVVGLNAGQGFINGFLSRKLLAYLAGKTIGDEAKRGAKVSLAERSPSKEFFKIGDYAVQGFVNGLLSMGNSVENAGASISKEALNSAANAMAVIAELMDEGIEYNPVIRPVLDSKSVEDGLYRLNDLASNSKIDATINSSENQNGRRLLSDAASNISEDQLIKLNNGSKFTTQTAEQFIAIGNKIIDCIQNGHDIYFDDGTFAGRINRRLGSL